MRPASSRREQASARRAQLIQVTLDLFLERGIENVTMAEVAARADVAPGLLYHYFDSKDGLLKAVLAAVDPREAFAGLAGQLSGLPAEVGLREFCVRAATLLEERGDVLRALFRELLSPGTTLTTAMPGIQNQVLADLSRYLTERVEAGELRPHDPRAPLRLLISGLLVLGVTHEPVEPWIDGFVDTVLSGIEAKG